MEKDLKERTVSLKNEWKALCQKRAKRKMEALSGDAMILCKSEKGERIGEIQGFPVLQIEYPSPMTPGAALTTPAVEGEKRPRGRPRGTRKADCNDQACVVRRTPEMRAAEACSTDVCIEKGECSVKWEPVQRNKRTVQPGEKVVTEYRCRCNLRGNRNYVADEVCARIVGPKPSTGGN